MHEHAVLYVQDVHDLGQREAQPWVPETRSSRLFLCLWSMELPLRLSRSTLFPLVPLRILVW
jgi:hypothetical protein